MAINLKHQTIDSFVARIKRRFIESSKYDRARMADWIYRKYESGDITQAQIRTAFELDTTEKWVAFRDRILALHNYYATIEAEK